MNFKPEKCNVIRFTRKRSPLIHDYSLSGHTLKETNQHKYLGVTLSADMKWNHHIDNITAKANSVNGFIRRNLSNAPVQVKTQAFKSLVRPHVEYCSSVWAPHTRKYIDKIESVQRRSARVITRHETEKNKKKRKIATCEGAQRPNLLGVGSGGGFPLPQKILQF